MSPYIIGFGIACIDYIVVSPAIERGGHTHVHDFLVQGGGLTGTSLVAAARLGARAKMLGRIGDDDIADQVARGLEEEGIDTSGLVRVPGRKSLFSVVIVDAETAERTIYCRNDTGAECGTDVIDMGAIKGADAMLLDAHWHEGALAAAREARGLGVPIVCDIRISPHNRPIVELCDFPIAPRSAISELTESGDPYEALEKIRSIGPRAAVITCGADGAYYSDEDGAGHVPAFEVDAVDTTGAGDVFHGAFAFGLTQGWSLRETVVFASAVSAIKCTQLGGRAGIPQLDQAMEFLSSRGHHLPTPPP